MAELCENIRNFEDMATYYRYTRSAQNIQRYNFTLATTVLNTEVGDDCATVELYAHITFQYEEGGETAECGDRYQVTFGKVGGTWCIVDIVSEEMIAYGMTPRIPLIWTLPLQNSTAYRSRGRWFKWWSRKTRLMAPPNRPPSTMQSILTGIITGITPRLTPIRIRRILIRDQWQ